MSRQALKSVTANTRHTSVKCLVFSTVFLQPSNVARVELWDAAQRDAPVGSGVGKPATLGGERIAYLQPAQALELTSAGCAPDRIKKSEDTKWGSVSSEFCLSEFDQVFYFCLI